MHLVVRLQFWFFAWGESYPSAEVQLAYSIDPANRTVFEFGKVLNFFFKQSRIILCRRHFCLIHPCWVFILFL